MERNRRSGRNKKKKEKKTKIKLESLKGNSKTKEKKSKKIVIKILFIIFLSVFLISSLYIIKWFLDIKRVKDINKKSEQEIKNSIVKLKNTEKINFANLKSLNEDIKIVIDFPVLNILQPVVQTNNNDFYINHDLYKKTNLAGAIFADYKNRFDFFEKNIIIYGNNMMDGNTMFSPLTKFFEMEFLKKLKDEDKIINIYNKNGKNRYEIFSIYKINDQNINPKNLYPKSQNELVKLIPKLKKRSMYNFDQKEIKTKQIITLITSTKNSNERLILHAYVLTEDLK